MLKYFQLYLFIASVSYGASKPEPQKLKQDQGRRTARSPGFASRFNVFAPRASNFEPPASATGAVKLPKMSLSQLPVGGNGEIAEIVFRLSRAVESVAENHGIYRVPGAIKDVKSLLKSLTSRGSDTIDLSVYTPTTLTSSMKSVFMSILTEKVIPASLLQKLVNIHSLMKYPNMPESVLKKSEDTEQYFKATLPILFSGRDASIIDTSLIMMCLIRDLPAVNRNMIAFLILHFQNVLSSQSRLTDQGKALSGFALAVSASSWYHEPDLSRPDRVLEETAFQHKAALLLGSIYRDWWPELICLARTPGSKVMELLCSDTWVVGQSLMALLEQKMINLDSSSYNELEEQLQAAQQNGNPDLVYYNIDDYKCSHVERLNAAH